MVTVTDIFAGAGAWEGRVWLNPPYGQEVWMWLAWVKP